MTVLRTVINFPPGLYPELQDDLSKIPKRYQAERLRMLASVGLICLRQGVAPGALQPHERNPAPAPSAAPPPEPADNAVRTSLKNRMKASVAN